MMNKPAIYAFAVLFFCAITMQAQKADNGKSVKRITFDREQVNIIYADGSTDEKVSNVKVTKQEKTTYVKDVNSNLNKQKGKVAVYDLQGRRVSNVAKGKGVFIVREGQRVRKIVKQ